MYLLTQNEQKLWIILYHNKCVVSDIMNLGVGKASGWNTKIICVYKFCHQIG